MYSTVSAMCVVRFFFLQVRIITSNNCLSAGDALRDIDQRGVVRSDPFILVSGDVVSNIDLKSVITQVLLHFFIYIFSSSLLLFQPNS